ncbi:MAG: tRNA (adenosine(37)-N6)-threonylcarbamoyltransferase complex dimerization subunit type 1 TsaB [Desulfobacteraceae bacterium]|nr:MAG: tRNA (adenosine(37)-N6)-threonylcarbamoyltransferase complex dimerization subunit type 1 TsaB [Desulfobacteraceae bacterium]
MKILAVDTSSRSCSVAVVENNNLLAEIIKEDGETHSRHLMDMIKKVFELSGLVPFDIDGYAVTKGPGSFTGLRIGISSVKGLAAATGKSLAGISTLDALAAQVLPTPYLICSVIDARKSEVYSSRYRFIDGLIKKEMKEDVFLPDQAADGIGEPSLFIGDGATLYRNIIEKKLGNLAHFPPPFINVIRASTVAFMGLKKFENKDTVDAALLAPHYIRKSDVKLNL